MLRQSDQQDQHLCLICFNTKWGRLEIFDNGEVTEYIGININALDEEQIERWYVFIYKFGSN